MRLLAGVISTQNPPIIAPTPSPTGAGNTARIFLKALVTPSWGSVLGTLLVAAALLAANVVLWWSVVDRAVLLAEQVSR